MAYFSNESKQKLATCHPDLQTLFNEVIKYFDCKITEGYRDRDAQEKAFAEGRTQLHWPRGNHNHYPSTAADVYPCPVDLEDTKRFYYFAGFVLGMAAQLKAQGKMLHAVRYGGDWNSDNNLRDNKFNDLVHYELIQNEVRS